MQKKTITEVVKFARIFAIFGIVIFHLSDVLKDTYSDFPLILYYFCHMGSQGIHIFFVSSALLLYLKYDKSLLNIKNFLAWFIKRLKKIYPSYVSSIIIISIIYVIADVQISPYEVILNLIPFIRNFSDELIHSINGNFWFLHTLLEFYLVFPLIMYVFYKIENKLMFLVLSYLISIFYIYIYSYLNIDSGHLNPASSFFLNYFYDFGLGLTIGYLLKYKYIDLNSIRKRHVLALIITFLLLEVIGFLLYISTEYGRNFNDLFFSLGIILASIIFFYGINLTSLKIKHHLAKLTDYVYDIYLIHHPVFKVVFLLSVPFLIKLFTIIILTPCIIIINYKLGRVFKKLLDMRG